MAEQLPTWQAPGVEPPSSLVTNGWQPGMKPSAQHMNWLFNRIYKCLEEIQAGGGTEELEQELATLQQALATHLADDMSHVYYADDTGTDNAKVIAISPVPAVYKKGLGISFTNKVLNTGAVTINVNGLGAKAVLKSNGNALTSGNLKANSIYTVRYNGTSFILQGEGGSGNALASDLLSGKTATTDAGDIVGTIPSKAAAIITPGTTNQTIAAAQYLSGIQTILGDPDLIAANIIAGKNIFNVAGTASIESLGGIKKATGTVTSSTTAVPCFTSVGQIEAVHITVTGLLFKPLVVVITAITQDNVNGIRPTLFSELMNLANKPGYDAAIGQIVYEINGTQMNNLYTTNNGFRLPVSNSGTAYRWTAYAE